MTNVSWSGMYDGQQNAPYSLLVNTDNSVQWVRHAAADLGFNKYGALFKAALGAAAGQAATKTRLRVADQTGPVGDLAASLGGKRAISTITDINRNTTAADVTMLKAMISGVKFQPTYPTEKSGSTKRWW